MDRFEVVADEFARQILDYEPELRAHLRLSLEPGSRQPDQLPLRQGRGIGWIEDALSPLRGNIPAAKLRRLVLAMRATFGIEAMVWLTDIAGVSRQQAVDIMRSSARTLLQSAIAEAARPANASAASRIAPNRANGPSATKTRRA